jgi:hypothetical protein
VAADGPQAVLSVELPLPLLALRRSRGAQANPHTAKFLHALAPQVGNPFGMSREIPGRKEVSPPRDLQACEELGPVTLALIFLME